MPTLAMLAACCLWAAAVVGTKLAVVEIAVAEFVVARLLLAAGGLWLMVLATRTAAEPRTLGWRPFAMGCLEPGLTTFLVSVGLTMTSPVNGAVFWSLMPLVMPLLGRLVLGEAIQPVVLVAALIGTAGTALLVHGQGGHGGGTLIGDMFLIAGVLSACANALIARRAAQRRGNPLATSAWQVTAACVMTAPMLFVLPVGQGHIVDAGPPAIGALLFLGLVVSTGVFILSNYAYRHIPVARMALFSCLVGPIGTAMSALLLGTRVTIADLGAIALVMLAVALPTMVRR